MLHARREQLRRGGLAGKRSFFFPVNVLRSDLYVRSVGRLQRRRQIQKRWACHGLVAAVSGNQRQKVAEEVASLMRSLVRIFQLAAIKFFRMSQPFV